MKRKYSEIFLAALLFELSAVIYATLAAAQTDDELEAATLEGYAQAHLLGALWASLGLLAVQLPRTKKNFGQVLETVAAESGVNLPKITSKPVFQTIASQARIATERLKEARAARTTSALPINTSAEMRAAGYAARWGVQQGIDDMAAGSSAVDTDGQELELLKTWVRLATRVEKRSWHDALNGVTIPYSQKFRVDSPRGVFFVSRPYDSKLPLSERIGCGHGIRVEPPRDAAGVALWDGGDLTANKVSARNTKNTVLPKARPAARAPTGEPISASLTVPDDARHKSVRDVLRLIDSVHGDGDLMALNISTKSLPKTVLGGYIQRGDGSPGGIVFNSKFDIAKYTVVEEIGHMLDHQVLAFGQYWASGREDSYTREVLQAIRASPTYKQMAGYQLGQRVNLVVNGEPAYRIIADGAKLNEYRDPKELFARAYVQYIAITTGDTELLSEIAQLRSTSNYEMVYNLSWQDDEFEPIAQAIEKMLRELRWTR